MELLERKHTYSGKRKTSNIVQLEGEIVWQGFVEACSILFVLTGYYMFIEGSKGCNISLLTSEKIHSPLFR